MELQFNKDLLVVLPLLLLPFLSLFLKWLPHKSNAPPSPPRLPVIGNLHQLGKHPYRSLQKLSQKHGDLILLHLGSKPTLVVSSADLACQVLKTHDAVFASRPNLGVFRRLLGDGNDVVSSPYGEHWRRLKRICTHELLSKTKVESYKNVREQEVELMVKEIQKLKIVNLSEMFRSLSNDFICRVAFGRKYRGGDGENGVDFNKLLTEFVELLGGHYVGDFVSWLAWIDRINGVNDKVNRVAKTFDMFIEGIIQERGGVTTENRTPNNDAKDFVDVLLQLQRSYSGRDQILDRSSIKALILDIFAAGTEAIYIVLEWMMSELLKNPRVLKELQKEISTVTRNEDIVVENELKGMSYMKAVLKETLRLHTPGPFLVPHESTRDVKINGFHVSAGTQVVVNAWSICRDSRYWKDPEMFYPERFLSSSTNFKGHDFEFIPFGSGRRMCPGMGFATTMVELVIANLVHRFEWSLPNGQETRCLDVTPAPGLVMHKKKPLIVVASPRI